MQILFMTIYTPPKMIEAKKSRCNIGHIGNKFLLHKTEGNEIKIIPIVLEQKHKNFNSSLLVPTRKYCKQGIWPCDKTKSQTSKTKWK